MINNNVILTIGVISFLFIILNLVVSIRITRELKKRGIDAFIAHRRGLIFKYLKIYKDITVSESGKPGPLYFQFLATFLLYIVILFIGILLVAI